MPELNEDKSPLRIDLHGQINRLVDRFPNYEFPSKFSQLASTSSMELLDTLAGLLAFPALTEEVAFTFQPILLDLCARWIGMEGLEDRLVFEAFALLLQSHKEIFP